MKVFMKVLVILATLSLLFAVGVFIYTEVSTKRVDEKHTKAHPTPPSTVVEEDTIKTPATQNTKINAVADPVGPNTPEMDIEEKENNKPSPHFSDWRDDEASDHREHTQSGDLWTDLIQKQNAKDRGAYIEDPENMDIDELVEAERLQLIERFGDIPEVYTYTSLKPRFLAGSTNFDENIAFLKSQYALFPSESTRKSIILEEWSKSRSGSTSTINQADIEYLKSQGITIIKNGTRITITTE